MEIAKLDVLISGDIQPLQTALKQGQASIEGFASQGADAFLNLNAGLSTTAKEALAAANDIKGLQNAMQVLEAEQAGIIRGTTLWSLYETELKKVDAQLETSILLEQQLSGAASKAGANANISISAIGKSLTEMIGSLRQVAYILPGIGIAGIFNLAFQAISDAASELKIFDNSLSDFNNKLTDVADNALKNLNAEIQKFNTQLGLSPSIAQQAQSALGDLNKQIEQMAALTNAGFVSFNKFVEFLNKAVPQIQQLTDKLAELNDKQRLVDFSNALLEQGKVNIKFLEDNAELQKQIDSRILSDQKQSQAKRIAAAQDFLAEQKKINKLTHDASLLSGTDKNLADENLRFANLQAEQNYQNAVINIEKQAIKKQEDLLIDRNTNIKHIQDQFIKAIATETGNPTGITNRDLSKGPGLGFPDLSKAINAAKAAEDLKKMNEQIKLVQETSQLLANSFSEIFVDLLTQGKINFRRLEQELIRFIAKLVEAKIEAFLLQTIFAALSGGTSAAVGAKLSSFIFSGIHLASGGIVSSPTTALIGESGPEAVIPLDKISQLFGSIGGSNIQISGELRAHGTDLVVALNRGNVRINRNYGSNFTN
jgi:hypothetical protein